MKAFLKAGPWSRGATRSKAHGALLGAAALLLLACSGDDAVGTEGPAAPEGPPGPEGPQGEQDEPAISAVTPSWVWLSRNESVTISGYDTAWTDGATVDFGPGVTVNDVIVASPTSIVAKVSVAETAAVGPHDVVVTADDGELTSAGGFEVRPGMEVMHLAGDGTQGSFNVFAVSLEDTQHDLAGGMFTTPGGIGFAHTVEGSAQGVHPALGITDQVFYEQGWAAFEVLIDINAPAEGPLSLSTTSLAGRTVTSTGLIAPTARTPESLTLDTPVTTSYGSEAFATHLFEYSNDSGSDQIVRLGVTAGGGGETMAFFYARGSGDASDGHLLPSTAMPVGVRDGESVYMMAIALEGDTDFDFDAEVDNPQSTAMFASQETDDEVCGDAQDTGIALAGEEGLVIDGGRFGTPITLVGGLGGADAESDWYRFSTTDASTSFSCFPHGNHDSLLIALYAADNCDDPLPDVTDLPPGDYFLRAQRMRSATLRGATRYAVVCLLSHDI